MVPWRGQKDLPEADALLWHAWSMHKGSLCPCGCGHPAKVALDPAARGSVDVDDETVCAYREALDEWSAGRKEPTPGVLPRLVLDERAYEIAKARLALSAGEEPVDG